MSLTEASDLPNQRRDVSPREPPGGGGGASYCPMGMGNFWGFAEVILEPRAEFQNGVLVCHGSIARRRIGKLRLRGDSSVRGSGFDLFLRVMAALWGGGQDSTRLSS